MTKILIDQAAVSKALEYIEYVPDDRYNAEHINTGKLITALRAALAQPEQPAQCFADWWQTTDGEPSYQEAFEAGRRAQPVNQVLLAALKLCYDHCRLFNPLVESNNVGEAVRNALAQTEQPAHVNLTPALWASLLNNEQRAKREPPSDEQIEYVAERVEAEITKGQQ